MNDEEESADRPCCGNCANGRFNERTCKMRFEIQCIIWGDYHGYDEACEDWEEHI